jgi:hypothetical protein
VTSRLVAGPQSRCWLGYRHMAADAHERSSSRVSLGGAIGVIAAFAVLVVLENTHQKSDPMLAGDNERVGKVMLSVFVAGIMTVVSFVFAVHPLSRGSLHPLVWLAGVAAAWAVFALVFDFRGLLK